jgi:hypothetical protein
LQTYLENLYLHWFSIGFQCFLSRIFKSTLAITPYVHKLLHVFHCLTLDKMITYIYCMSLCYYTRMGSVTMHFWIEDNPRLPCAISYLQENNHK